MNQAKATTGDNRQPLNDCATIAPDTLYQLDPNELRRHYIALLRVIMKATGEKVIVIRLN